MPALLHLIDALVLPVRQRDHRIAVLDSRREHEARHSVSLNPTPYPLPPTPYARPPHKMSSPPPSTPSVVPSMNFASEEARKQIAAAISPGSPPSPVIFSLPLFTFG